MESSFKIAYLIYHKPTCVSKPNVFNSIYDVLTTLYSTQDTRQLSAGESTTVCTVPLMMQGRLHLQSSRARDLMPVGMIKYIEKRVLKASETAIFLRGALPRTLPLAAGALLGLCPRPHSKSFSRCTRGP